MQYAFYITGTVLFSVLTALAVLSWMAARKVAAVREKDREAAALAAAELTAVAREWRAISRRLAEEAAAVAELRATYQALGSEARDLTRAMRPVAANLDDVSAQVRQIVNMVRGTPADKNSANEEIGRFISEAVGRLFRR